MWENVYKYLYWTKYLHLGKSMTQLENVSGYVYDFTLIFTDFLISYVLDIAQSNYFSCQTDLVEEC